jgi:hypothetical protein
MTFPVVPVLEAHRRSGFIYLMERLRGRAITKFDLFKLAVYIEQVLLNKSASHNGRVCGGAVF